MSSVSVHLIYEDAKSRVNRFEFEDGDETTMHLHEYNYIVVPITGGEFNVENASGELKSISQVAGVPYAGVSGTHHNVINASRKKAVFVEIELKH